MSSDFAAARVNAALQTLHDASAAGNLTGAACDNIRRWLTSPGYEVWQAALLDLVERQRFDELEPCFWEVLPFGTGGRRGPMAELGSATVNERTVAESAYGLAVYMRRERGQLTVGDAAPGRVAVAFDTRHRSKEFAKLTARVLAAQGLRVFLFDGHRATPELSFAVRHLKCDAGVMISASHNPPSDNGIKVYWSDGGQVLPPHDQGIIDAVARAGVIPLVEFDAAVFDGRIVAIGPEVDRAYIAAVANLSLSPARKLSILYSPLHGVGETSVAAVLRQAGFSNVEIFGPQREPSGDFPNVPQHLANPELPAVFDSPIARAREIGADLVLASDPDADRLGAAVRAAGGEYVYLSGNRLGALLTDYILRQGREAGTLTPADYVLTTLVTTPLVSRVARSYGVRVIDDLLVGFKYIAGMMERLGPRHFAFGCEESLGYLAGDYCRDKDAAIAALYLCELAAMLRAARRTLLDRLDELYVQHGYVAERQHNETCRGPQGRAKIDLLMTALRDAPPASVAGLRLTHVRDYGRHELRELPENRCVNPLPEPRSELLIFESRDPGRHLSLAIRPSGTEPKVKFYLFLTSAVEDSSELDAVRRRTENLSHAVMAEFQECVRAGLEIG